MINRELTRTKIIQLAYAYFVNDNNDPTNAEKELLFSMSKAYELYLLQLNLINAIRDEAEHIWGLEAAKAEREKQSTPKRRFIDNQFALQLKSNESFLELSAHKNISWSEDIEVVRHLLQLILQSQSYQEYMQKDSTTYEEDKELWCIIYKNIISQNDQLAEALEGRSLYWNDDKYVIDTFVLKTIRRFSTENATKQPLIQEYQDSDIHQFAIRLFRTTIQNSTQFQSYIQAASKNWDLSRLSLMDSVIMRVALAEMFTFPEIAIKITINEYIELAKAYSTTKSSSYINGMLDAIARQLIAEGVLLKKM
ncbi:MAG: transcription antitermination factor NusB [Bacteroidaceae bacterium]|nr:transcription antitermination factor NusB [Bacteroidaceae bacterium]